MPYPPTTFWRLSEERESPNLPRDFLANLVSGKSKVKLSAKSLRIVNTSLRILLGYYKLSMGNAQTHSLSHDSSSFHRKCRNHQFSLLL